MSTNNILSPANGKPIIVPSQDIVLGLYYLTMEGKNEPGAGMAFAEIGALQHAIESGAVPLHSQNRARFKVIEPDGSRQETRREGNEGVRTCRYGWWRYH